MSASRPNLRGMGTIDWLLEGDPAIRWQVLADLTDDLVAEITASVKARKGSVQAPKQVLAVDAIPLTGLGKPDKKALRAGFWKDAGRSVG